jgi:hypothetical protein
MYNEDDIREQLPHILKKYPGHSDLFIATDMSVFSSFDNAYGHVNSGTNESKTFYHYRNGELAGVHHEQNAIIIEKKKHPRDF